MPKVTAAAVHEAAIELNSGRMDEWIDTHNKQFVQLGVIIAWQEAAVRAGPFCPCLDKDGIQHGFESRVVR